MINASPNLNGNSAKDFADAALELDAALDLVEKALGKIRANVFHGRNYQHISVWQMESARTGDDLQQTHAVKSLDELKRFKQAVLSKAIEG